MRSITHALAQAIPTARTREIEGAAHAVPLDSPHEFGQVILDELDTKSSQAAGGNSPLPEAFRLPRSRRHGVETQGNKEHQP